MTNEKRGYKFYTKCPLFLKLSFIYTPWRINYIHSTNIFPFPLSRQNKLLIQIFDDKVLFLRATKYCFRHWILISIRFKISTNSLNLFRGNYIRTTTPTKKIYSRHNFLSLIAMYLSIFWEELGEYTYE